MDDLKSDFSVVVQSCVIDSPGTVEEAIKTIVRDLSLAFNINISCLDQIILSENYFNDVSRYKRNGLKKSSPTQNEFGIGIAITIPFKTELEIRTIIFFDFNIANGFLKTARGRKQFIHYLHHELCHVEDIYNKSIRLKEFLTQTVNGPDIYLLTFALSMWDEYYAHIKSVQTLDDDDFSDYELMLDVFEEMKTKINECIKEYRTNHDLNGVLEKCMPYIQFALCSMAKVAGNVHGKKLSFEKIFGDKFLQLVKTQSYQTYLNIEQCLGEMFAAYTSWTSVKVFTPLKRIVDEYIIQMGFILQTTDNGDLYVKIPLRPENTPTW